MKWGTSVIALVGLSTALACGSSSSRKNPDDAGATGGSGSGGAGQGGNANGTGGSAAGTAPQLVSLTTSEGSWDQEFAGDVTSYVVSVPLLRSTLTLTPTAPDGATITVNDVEVASGTEYVAAIDQAKPVPLAVTVTGADGAETAYVVTVVRNAPSFVKSTGTGNASKLGLTVALDGDDLIIADQPREMLHVYRKVAGVWEARPALAFPTADEALTCNGYDSYFGCSLALRDGRLVVGARTICTTGATATVATGAVYYTTRGTDGTWAPFTSAKKLIPGRAQAWLGFGSNVVFDGTTLAILSGGDQNPATGLSTTKPTTTTVVPDGPDADTDGDAIRSGSVYLYSWPQAVASPDNFVAYLRPSVIRQEYLFGTAIALDGDLLAVGAPGSDSGAPNDLADNSLPDAGVVYVYRRVGDQWTFTDTVFAPNAATLDRFGSALSLNSSTLAVGAPDRNAKSGAAFLFPVSGQGVVGDGTELLLDAPPDTNDRYGAVLSREGDWLTVGAPGDGSAGTGYTADAADNSLANSGASHVFHLDGADWHHFAYLKAPVAPGAGDFFGASGMSLNGARLTVGSPWEDSSAKGFNGDQKNNDAVDSGAVFFYE